MNKKIIGITTVTMLVLSAVSFLNSTPALALPNRFIATNCVATLYNNPSPWGPNEYRVFECPVQGAEPFDNINGGIIATVNNELFTVSFAFVIGDNRVVIALINNSLQTIPKPEEVFPRMSVIVYGPP